MTYTLHRRQQIARPVHEVFSFFANAGNLDLLTPPWLRFRVTTPQPIAMCAGARIEYSIRWRGLPTPWLTEIERWEPRKHFVDVQLRGPYRRWHHTHTFQDCGDRTTVEDIVRYELPMGALGRLAHSLIVRRDIESIFDYRAKRIAELFR